MSGEWVHWQGVSECDLGVWDCVGCVLEVKNTERRADSKCKELRSGTEFESGSSGSAGAVSAGSTGARAGLEAVESSENRSHHQMEGYGLLKGCCCCCRRWNTANTG
jgi:hypothetical protein